eukprot:scaffold36314_cov31-Tisochrysis_lutea.AAC.3
MRSPCETSAARDSERIIGISNAFDQIALHEAIPGSLAEHDRSLAADVCSLGVKRGTASRNDAASSATSSFACERQSGVASDASNSGMRDGHVSIKVKAPAGSNRKMAMRALYLALRDQSSMRHCVRVESSHAGDSCG